MATSNQTIRFCTAADGVKLAYAVSGRGRPLVKAANYLTHLELDWDSIVWRHWLRELSSGHALVRYDERGSGLSDRTATDFSMDAWVRDLEAVVDASRLERFALLGISQGASVSVAYAAQHPERVSRLVLYGGYARGRFHRDLTAEQRLEAETMINAIRVGWGKENPAFRQLFSTQLMPDGSPEQTQQLNELARLSATAETASEMERAFYQIDVTALATRVKTPTLVLHARHDAAIPFEEGRQLAALIPNARFVPLESRNHILLEEEPAWDQFLDEVRSFLEIGHARPAHTDFPALTTREREVLDLVARGLSNASIAEQLAITPKTVRNHLTHVFDKLGVATRAEAIVLGREAGFGH